jgi:hypothetical protein
MPKVVGVIERKDRVLHSTCEVWPDPATGMAGHSGHGGEVRIFNYCAGDSVPTISPLPPASAPDRPATSADTNIWRPGYMGADEDFVVLQVEARVIGVEPEAVRGALEQMRLTVAIMDKSVFEIDLASITVTDSVLETRVKRLESLLDGIVSAEAGKDETVDRLRATLLRLGWKPYRPVDYRSLVRPLLIAKTASYYGVIQVPPNVRLSRPVGIRVMLRGVISQALL